MKKILFVLLAAFVFGSCSKDSDIMPSDGQYVTNAMDIVVSLVLKNGKCTALTIYSKGERFDYTPTEISTKGDYPKYLYTINEFSVSAYFDSIDSFSGVLNGILRNREITDGLQDGTIIVFGDEIPIPFVLDNTPLDVNGDGILDRMQ